MSITISMPGRCGGSDLRFVRRVGGPGRALGRGRRVGLDLAARRYLLDARYEPISDSDLDDRYTPPSTISAEGGTKTTLAPGRGFSVPGADQGITDDGKELPAPVEKAAPAQT